MRVLEVYRPKRMTASGQLTSPGGVVGGFICTTTGTIQITVGEASGGADIVSTMAVTAAVYYPLGFFCETGAYAVLASGAAGTFLV